MQNQEQTEKTDSPLRFLKKQTQTKDSKKETKEETNFNNQAMRRAAMAARQ